MNVQATVPALVSIKDLNKGYGEKVKVLRGLNFDMRPGERVVVIGPSGGGKSALLRIVMGLEEIQGGSVTFAGQPFIGSQGAKTRIDADMRKKIGMVFQHYTPFPHLSVMQNLTLAPRRVNRESQAKAIERGRAILARFGLEQKADAYPSQLSRGQKQRVAIARALMLDPQLMLFDEVTSALDPELVAEVEQVILNLAAQGMPMMLVAHDMWFARNVANRVIFCAGGVVVEDGPPEQVLGNPSEERTREFIDRVFHVKG